MLGLGTRYWRHFGHGQRPKQFGSASTQNSSESEVRRFKSGLRIYIEIIYNLNLFVLNRTVIRLIKFDYHYFQYND